MSYYVISGEWIFTIEWDDYPVKKDDVIIVPPEHSFTYTGKLELLLLTTPIYFPEDETEIWKNPKWDSFIPPVEKTESETLKESLARSQADYQNLLMRVDRDKADMISYLSAKIVLPLLKEVDNLERAVKLKEWVEGDGFIDGVRTVLQGMEKFLETQWVKSFPSIGEEVNPDRHDVMTQANGPEWKIITEFEKGYLIGDRVLRHAKVVVGNWE